MSKILETGKLIVRAIAVAGDPSGTAAATLGIDTALKIKSWLAKNPDLENLATELGAKFHKDLEHPRFDKPAEARTLLPQMLDAAFPSGDAIASCGLDANLILAEMHESLANKDGEYRRPAIVNAFDSLMLPLLRQACNDPRLEAALRPHLTREQMRDAKDLKSMMQSLLAGDYISLDAMKTLAREFGAYQVENQAELRKFLTLKADEYRALKSEVDAIDDGLKRLSNLKAAAQDAIARVDLEEVEELLSRVQEVELEEAAKTAELRANNALLRGKVDQAYRLLSAAADSFAVVDPLEPARRSIQGYNITLKEHARRYGGNGYIRCLELLARHVTQHLKDQDLKLWAQGENTRAIALSEQGTRTGGAEGADLLAEAVAAYRAALEVFTRADHPVDWATTQNNLGNALADQGIRTGGAAGADLLAEAVTAYRAALEVFTRADHPVRWATIQNNLGIALRNQGTRTDGAEGADLLAEAVTAYRAALEVHTRADHPVDWAMTQNNLGNALQNQGTRTGGAEGADLLAEAVAAYRAALEVTTRADHPVAWATTQNNLGNALGDQGTRTGGAEGADLLAEAVTAYRTALEVHTRANHPVDWAKTQENIAIAELDRARHEATADPRPHLEAALAAVEGALEVFDPEHMSYNHEKATRLRNEIRAEIDKLP